MWVCSSNELEGVVLNRVLILRISCFLALCRCLHEGVKSHHRGWYGKFGLLWIRERLQIPNHSTLTKIQMIMKALFCECLLTQPQKRKKATVSKCSQWYSPFLNFLRVGRMGEFVVQKGPMVGDWNSWLAWRVENLNTSFTKIQMPRGWECWSFDLAYTLPNFNPGVCKYILE